MKHKLVKKTALKRLKNRIDKNTSCDLEDVVFHQLEKEYWARCSQCGALYTEPFDLFGE